VISEDHFLSHQGGDLLTTEK